MKVLVIKTSSMGDVIHTLPALTDAVTAIPGIRFDWVVEEGFAEIPAWHPAVDRVLPVALRRWRKNILQTWRSGEWRAFKQALLAQEYDAVIDAQGLLKSAFLVRYGRGPSYGLDKNSAREPLSARFYDHPVTVAKEQHAVERVRQLFAQSLGYGLPEGQQGHFSLSAEVFEDREGLRPSSPYVVFLHGTTWPDKHWPEPYWCQLADRLAARGMNIVLPWGNPVERERAERIQQNCKGVTVLPRLRLRQVASVIAGAQAVVAVDTGLGHLTAALEVPGVSLYGPTRPLLVGAYGDNQQHLVAKDCKPVNCPDIEPQIFAPLTPDIVMDALQPALDRASI
ncbi:lipopolysaccharide heptosyltransferase I [Endozoicomonadaceae bacterium StTr2]